MMQLLNLYILLIVAFGLLFCVIGLIYTFWHIYLGICLVAFVLVGVHSFVRKLIRVMDNGK